MVSSCNAADAADTADTRDTRDKSKAPTWSSGPEGRALLGGAPLRTTPLSPSTSTSMPWERADMPAPLSALATTRAGADAAPRMEREGELGLAIAESAWYAAMGGSARV